MIWATFLMALREIRRHPMRSTLTTLGIVIGVGAVITMVTIGQGATDKVTADISSLGNNMLIVSPGAERRGPTTNVAAPLTMDDVRAIEREIATAQRVAPTSSKGVLAVYGAENWNTSITGTTEAFLDVRGYKVELGRAFSPGELDGGAAACVLGATVKKELFGSQDPIDATIRLGTYSCRVIGSLLSKGQSSLGSDQDDFILMPLLTYTRRIANKPDIGTILVSATSPKVTGRTKTQIELLLRQRRKIQPGEKDDFTVRDIQEISQAVQSTTTALTALLGAIAGVSLLVGGIGIMNIMLVSVTERTREIGIRLAIGARASEVLLQFLVEAMVLSAFGGMVGVALGLGGSFAATRALGLPFTLLPDIILIALLFSASVGVVFGFYPARKAARLNPIDALRHE